MKKKDIQEEHLQIISDCEDRESKLTDWETTFLDSVRNRIERNLFLTEKQEEILDKIWEKCTKEG